MYTIKKCANLFGWKSEGFQKTVLKKSAVFIHSLKKREGKSGFSSRKKRGKNLYYYLSYDSGVTIRAGITIMCF